MKIRWTQGSIRLRITPPELEALGRDTSVRASLAFPGGLTWHVALLAGSGPTRLTSDGEEVTFHLGHSDREGLERPDAEGVYFKTDTDPPLRYFVEKDFPCAHPRLVDAIEAAPETFAPTADFEARKALQGDDIAP